MSRTSDLKTLVRRCHHPRPGAPIAPLRHMVGAAGRLKMALGLLPQIGNRKLESARMGEALGRSHSCILGALPVTPQNCPSDLVIGAQFRGAMLSC